MNWAPNWKPGHLPQNFGKRLPSVLLVGTCIGLVLWSVMIRLTLVTEAQSHMHSSFSLARELERLRTSWFQDEADGLTQDWIEFQSRNFRDYDQVVEWISRFSTQAQALGFQVTYKIGDQVAPVTGVPSITPLSIQFNLQTERDGDAYRHFMEFMKAVTETDIAVTLDKVDLSGTGRKVQKLELVLTAFMNQKT